MKRPRSALGVASAAACCRPGRTRSRGRRLTDSTSPRSANPGPRAHCPILASVYVSPYGRAPTHRSRDGAGCRRRQRAEVDDAAHAGRHGRRASSCGVPSTFTRRVSARFGQSPTTAAVCTIASTAADGALQCAGVGHVALNEFHALAARNSRLRGSTSRTRPRTWWPRATSAVATRLPVKPVAPVMSVSWLGSFCGPSGNRVDDLGRGMALRAGNVRHRSFPHTTRLPRRGVEQLAGLVRLSESRSRLASRTSTGTSRCGRASDAARGPVR